MKFALRSKKRPRSPSEAIQQDALRKNGIGVRFRKDWDLYLLLLPGLIWFILFAYVPMGGLVIAFQDYNVWKGIAGSEWVGLQNFIDFVTDDVFVRVVKNTLMLSLYNIVFCFPAPIILAILLTEMRNRFLSRITQTVTFIPYFISLVVVCGMVLSFCSPSTGLINIILRSLGLEEHYFMVDPDAFRPIYTIMMMWRETGFNAIVYVAALMGIDRQLYEAAKVDGASKWQQIRYVTLPGLMPTIVTMFILQIGKLVKVSYEAVLLLYQPATYETADVIGTYVYRTGLMEQNFGLATAAGLFESLIALVLVVLSNKISKKVSETALW
ncbi:ABC transporter permease subunit [uncultured Subdoligranulum sp.]|uniref:ABC transporter permease n=2 Tax=uncultured Subdoligranulum sp. TaxID=512298 RepID=UPI002624B808|nr:ABC transporter permease subunit [uncultured Subdoligranulum sp.]